MSGAQALPPGSQAGASAAGRPYQGLLAALGQGLWWPLPWSVLTQPSKENVPLDIFFFSTLRRSKPVTAK